MGLFDFLSGKNSDEKAVASARKTLMNPYHQSVERYGAIDELVKIGSEAALRALMGRFTYRVDGPTTDEEEKRYALGKLPEFGEAAIPVLREFIKKENAVYFPLQGLREIAGDEEAVDALLEAIHGLDPGFHQDQERLREIVSNLRDFRHERVCSALVEMLASRAVEIRFYALDGLAAYPAAEVAQHFAHRILDPDETQRVRLLATELACEHAIPLGEWLADIAEKLPPGYLLDSTGLVRHK